MCLGSTQMGSQKFGHLPLFCPFLVKSFGPTWPLSSSPKVAINYQFSQLIYGPLLKRNTYGKLNTFQYRLSLTCFTMIVVSSMCCNKGCCLTPLWSVIPLISPSFQIHHTIKNSYQQKE